MSATLKRLMGFFFPQRNGCHVCGAPLTVGEGLLCGACQRLLNGCAFGPGRCETVMESEIAFAASAYRYRDAAATLVKALKFASDRTAALPLAEGMAKVFTEYPALREAELCVPVPVHYKRLRRRGYNQAAVLCAAFGEMTGLPVFQDALVRVHHKKSQVGQGREARMENIKDAFAVSTWGVRRVRGRRVLLLDDVLTTGATCEACAEALQKAGARSVLVLTACRV